MRPLLLGIAACLAATPAWAQDGEVLGIAFRAGTGQTLSGVELVGPGGVLGSSDGRGVLRATLAAGVHSFEVRYEGRSLGTIEVAVADGQLSEVLLTVDPAAGTVYGAVEAPTVDTTTHTPEAVVTGRIAGRVVDEDEGTPISGARIFVRGLDVEARTAADGTFALDVPPGSWDLSLVRDGYATQSVPGVEVVADAVVDLPVTLVPAGLELADFTVTAPRVEGGSAALLDERRASGAVSDVLGAEQMSRAGDSDAAGALKRVTGLTLVGDKYVYVRGLGERYSATLLDGANLPSPEPERRVVPLDLFPTAVLESVVIQKTFTPDMPAEFGGGTIVLRTRSVPTEPILAAKIGVGGNTLTTFREGYRAPRGPTDFLGIDAGYRALPAEVEAASEKSPLEETDRFSDRGYTADELEQFGEAISNRWGLDRRVIPPDLGITVTGGDGFDAGPWAVGMLASVLYGSSWDTDRYHKDYFVLGADNALEPGNAYDFDQTVHDVRLGGLVHVGAELPGKHTLGLTSLLTRSTEDTARLYEGFNRDLGGSLAVGRTRWEERMLLVNQLAGHHLLPGHIGLDWRYTFSWATRLEPDRREWRRDLEDEEADVWRLSDRPEGNQIFYSDLADLHHDAGIDLTLPFGFLGRVRTEEGAATVRVGGAMVLRGREVDTRRYKYFHKGPISRDEEVLGREIEDVFTPETIGPDGFQFEEYTRQTDNYRASQTVFAGYALLDLPLPTGTRVVTGLRVEQSSQEVVTFELFNPDAEPVVAHLSTLDFLPAVVLTQALPAQMQLRAGYGRTLSRPDFRELSPATYNDVTGGRQEFGNPDLARAVLENVDLRWEWFPTPGDVISVGGFYKHFTDPIESIVVVSAQHSVTYANAEGANNFGLEVEVRKQLDFVAPALRDVYVAANASWIDSRVVIGENTGIQTSNERPLQGQSPWVYNAQIGYANPDDGLSASLVYHVFGPRIVEVGALGAPDTLELPVHQLDLVASATLPGGVDLGLSWKNILDWPIELMMGDQVTESLKEGWAFSLGVGWKR